ncbi:MAG: membrane-bound lytic murein transglycosylase B [Cocleimonas sp.]|jgi:membrane-bound lytic murein transglycosylase B
MCVSSIAISDVGFEKWKQSFRKQALKEGILPRVFDQSLSDISPDQEVIDLDNSQPEFTRNIWDYLNNTISSARIKKGKELLEQHRTLFDKIENRYGVQREIITAIWAMESDFGRNYGNKNVIRSLATLAYTSNSDKRLNFARGELLVTLKIIQAKKINREKLVGSWAGAMGQSQFMPSSYLQYGVDYNRDGKIDLWNTVPDVFASIAHFLSGSGWRKEESWGEEVHLPKQFDWRLNSSAYQLRYEQWQELNIHRIDKDRFRFPQRQAALFIPAGKEGPVFLVAHNFSVIKKYNQSSSYALAVAQLSNLFGLGKKIQGTWPVKDKAMSVDKLKEIQSLLNSHGHSVGVVDGKIGSITREAIRTWQLENGLPGDGYANLALLFKLRQRANLKK